MLQEPGKTKRHKVRNEAKNKKGPLSGIGDPSSSARRALGNHTAHSTCKVVFMVQIDLIHFGYALALAIVKERTMAMWAGHKKNNAINRGS